MSAKTFLLGLGTQKAGTSWLHDYLRTHPDCATGFTKEYHVLDVHYVPEMAEFRTMLEAQYKTVSQRAAAGATGPDFEKKKRKVYLKKRFVDDIAAYYAYFADLAAPEHIRLVADITPTYMLLSAEALDEIQTHLEARGFTLVPTLIMRDPVARTVSAVRMNRRRAQARTPGLVLDSSVQQMVAEAYAEPHFSFRCRYDQTLAALDKARCAKTALVYFYEEMFTEDWLAEFCAKTGIRVHPAEFDKRVNTAPDGPPEGPEGIDLELSREIVRHHADTYRALFDRFGAERVRAIWPSAALFDRAVSGRRPPLI